MGGPKDPRHSKAPDGNIEPEKALSGINQKAHGSIEFDLESVRRIADVRRAAESKLEAEIAAVPDSEKVEDYLPPFRTFACSLFDAEASEALPIIDGEDAYKNFLEQNLSPRIIDGILPDRGLKRVKAKWSAEVRDLSVEQEIDSAIIRECRPDGTTEPAREEIQAAYGQHGDWERFAPDRVRLGLRLGKSALVREELRQVLKQRSFYWLGRLSLRPAMLTPQKDMDSLMTEPRREAPSERFHSTEVSGDGRTTRTLGWGQLADQLEGLKAVEPLRAQWSAYVASEPYGIWLLRPDGECTAQVRATFTLIAAQVIEKLGIPPIPVPQPQQHCPHWREYCKAEEDLARGAGKDLDLSKAVPWGLGVVDWDAVDPCTRAFLEVLRDENLAFHMKGNGTSVVRGQKYSSVTGGIDDLCGAAASYCKRRARDEIETRLRSRSKQNRVTPNSVDGDSGHAAANVLDPFQGASARPLGDNPFPAEHPAYQAFEEATWKAKEALNGLRSELLETISKPSFDFIQSILTFRVREASACANAALLIVGNEQTAERYERWIEDFAKFVLEDTMKKGQAKNPLADSASPPLFTPELLLRIRADLSLRLMQVVAHYKKEAANRVLRVMELRARKSSHGEETAPAESINFAAVQLSHQPNDEASIASEQIGEPTSQNDQPVPSAKEEDQSLAPEGHGPELAESFDGAGALVGKEPGVDPSAEAFLQIAQQVPPRRTPDLDSSRHRLALVATLARELAIVKQEVRRFCTVDSLKRKHPKFTLWTLIEDSQVKALVDGEEFTPKAYAENLTLAKFGLTSRETLKKDRRKLRRAKQTGQQ